MGSVDWLVVGLKLLGAYFFVDGLGHAVWAALTIFETLPRAEDWGASFLSRLGWYQTAAHVTVRLRAALVLLFGTNWCVRLISRPSADQPSDTRITAS